MFRKAISSALVSRLPRRQHLSLRSALPRTAGVHTEPTKDVVTITFMDWEGNRYQAKCRVGQSILDVAEHHDVELFGTCGGGGGTVEVQRTPLWREKIFGDGPQCYSCHVVLDKQTYQRLNAPEPQEKVVLDKMIQELQHPTSRLGCQLIVTPEMDGAVVYLPDTPEQELP